MNYWRNLAIGLHVMFCFRTFKRALTSPMLFQVEVMVTLWIIDAMKDDEGYWKIWVNKFGILGAMTFTSFLIHRGRVFVNKVTYIAVSVATAFKNKKQRIKGQWICFLL